ncbi:flagellar biosynthetic protein FliR [[Clostridium] polysaccharolyticum]|uniref:Flagellar biosynthetic protein FliR n=1 Tax=[Clostridium] polysaccharolyticum TaxID=29364 RepID=A0A1H9Y2L6_9FIRM|nr:flagellar biosynthetic protein FliR [[Clostridium] polysaccharolyticum]SES63044.1 flagellar biosynthetic protein FliR [[Clostridium] polysaccharolyticum]
MNLTFEKLEFFFAVLVRISAFIMAAPFFSQRNIPVRVKAALSFFLSVIVFNMTEYTPIGEGFSTGYAVIIIEEMLIGATLGYTANLCMYVLDLAGRLIDTEIGFSMVNVLNPASNIQTSITGSMLTYFVMLIMLVSRMYYFIISAIADTFEFLPVGRVRLPSNIYLVVVKFIKEYFILGFRIVLPVFATILVVNIVLGVLAKVAPQMNMFVIGMQLKLLVGLIVLLLLIGMLPSIADFIYSEMKYVLSDMVKVMTPK